jgi:hypothetical protein
MSKNHSQKITVSLGPEQKGLLLHKENEDDR